MSDYAEAAQLDSLKRQIIEVKRQINQIKNRSKSKMLEIRRKTDQRKARLVLKTLKLKKQLNDCQNFLEESRKQWDSELHQSCRLIMV
jgi:signal transduction histidine kinase